MAHDLPPELPLSTYQWHADSALKKQQRVFGVVAQALSRGLDMMEKPLNQINHMTEMIEDTEVRQQIRSSAERIQEEALTPVGHLSRYLAANFNDIAFRRREAAASAARNKVLQQQLRSKPLGFDSFFKEDPSSMITAAAGRQQQSALTNAIRETRRPVTK